MIITNFTLGLGNQLFQYATGYALAKIKGVEHTIDVVSGLSAPRSQNHIYLFSPKSREIQLSELKNLSWVFELPGRALSDVRYDLEILRVLDPVLWIEPRFSYSNEFREKPQTTGYLLGYWQALPYFQDYAQELKREFSIRAHLSDNTKQLADDIRNSNSIFLHVRRGDYLKLTYIYGSLDRYYETAIDLVLQQTSNASLYVFSDDINWTKRNIRAPLPITFVDHTSASTAHEDLYLMTLCRHSIIANSTFSWWGAWLSEQTGIRIAPQKWFVEEKLNRQTQTLIPQSWIRI